MANSGNSPEPPKQGFRITLMQGLIGAVSLAGTTAIPLLVQRVLTPPTPSPTQSIPAQVQPAQVTPTVASPQEPSGVVMQEDDNKGKGKKKTKKKD